MHGHLVSGSFGWFRVQQEVTSMRSEAPLHFSIGQEIFADTAPKMKATTKKVLIFLIFI